MTVFAYLDPGSGSLIMQLLLGGVAGLAVTFKMWWSRVKSFLRIGPRSSGLQPDEAHDEAPRPAPKSEPAEEKVAS